MPRLEATLVSLRYKMFQSPFLGSFAGLVIVCAIYRHIMGAHESIRGVFFPRPDHRELAIRNLNGGAAEAFETLLRQQRGNPGPSSVSDGGLPPSSKVECYVLLSLMLFHAPRKDILNYARCLVDRHHPPTAEARVVTSWVCGADGRDARMAANYAACLLSRLASCPIREGGGFHQPAATLWAALVLWTFSRFTAVTDTAVGSRADVGERGGEGAEQHQYHQRRQGCTIRLDREWATAEIRAWHDGAVEGLRPHMKDVGYICRPSGAGRILDVAIGSLTEMRAWSFGKDLAAWLLELKTCAA